MRCLITGVAGFIGSHLADRLLAEGHEVWGIDNFTDDYARQLKEHNLESARTYQRFRMIEEDLLETDIERLTDGMEWIFHLAGQTNQGSHRGQDFARSIDCNLRVTQHLLNAVEHSSSLRRFIYASSSSVYGDTPVLPVFESMPLHPLSLDGITKMAAERLCALYHHNFGLPTVSLRYFTVYGPRQRPDMAFARFCEALQQHQPIHIYSDGQQRRDFTYISDAIDATLLAANREGAIGESLNIAGGSCFTLNCAVRLLQEISGVPVAVTFEDRRPGDVRNTYADTEKAERLLKFYPRVSLYEGLANEFSLYSSYSHEKTSVA